MSDASASTAERRRALLDQASAALGGRMVALWRIVDAGEPGRAVTEFVSVPCAPAVDPIHGFDVLGLLHRWGRIVAPESVWLGCRIDEDNWHVTPVRLDPPQGPPTGVERRSPERLVVELAGFCFASLEPMWLAADQATVYLCAALASIEDCLGSIRGTLGLNVSARARLLADLAAVADSINGALRT